MQNAPREETQRRAAWVLARALEGGDTVVNVLWLASQLEVVENDWRARPDPLAAVDDIPEPLSGAFAGSPAAFDGTL